MVIIISGKINNFKEVEMLKPAFMLLIFSAANAHWHVLDSVQSPQNSLSVVHLRLLAKLLLFLCSADDSIR